MKTNYDDLTLEELQGVLNHIDKSNYPERYSAALKALNEKRENKVEVIHPKSNIIIFILSVVLMIAIWLILPGIIKGYIYMFLYYIYAFFISPILSLF